MKFSPANRKLKKLAKTPFAAKHLTNNRKIYSFDLLAGWSCPFADKCKSKVHKTKNGLRIQDGNNTEFRCYAASLETLYTSVYNVHKHNYNVMKYHSRTKGRLELAHYIKKHIPEDAGIIRLHSSGDFFSMQYFDAWALVARWLPDTLFYTYTKAIGFWSARIGQLTDNFVLTASYGGSHDSLIKQLRLRSSLVVHSVNEANKLGLKIDDNDSLAANPNSGNFALLIHGTQPVGTKAAKAVYKVHRGIK